MLEAAAPVAVFDTAAEEVGLGSAIEVDVVSVDGWCLEVAWLLEACALEPVEDSPSVRAVDPRAL